ncbi:Protein RALF-like 1 [Apostasia shenzhenica]|uniref:Protein RALF-like 1 n=1 Tax=Apostasia shenzhenica TaxID=1088818 RepID=A0A2I0AZQ5_9ASPA|nr:Protein RALF-like 1 [Apostasia shenzhenica]
MESEISRRILWGTLPTKYVSYDALRRDSVPCDRLGAPYYSCHEGGALKANPYARGCSRIAEDQQTQASISQKNSQMKNSMIKMIKEAH